MAGTTIATTAPTSAAGKQGRVLRWGDRSVTERMIVQDAQDTVKPQGTRIRLEESGILEELQHHFFATNLTVTPGTGTAVVDKFGPYSLVSPNPGGYAITAGSNTPLISLTGLTMGLLQEVEYPDRSFEANAVPASVLAAEPDVTSAFSYPAATGTLRYWARIPVALKWLGMPGGSVGYLILQNKRISNVLSMLYSTTGAAAPYSIGGTTSGQQPYDVTGNGTVTASPIVENHKILWTVPDARSKMPVFGFTRYLQEVIVPYSGSTFKYLFEPGGLLLRAFPWFLDAGTTPVTDAQIANIIFSYGTNRQIEIWTTFRNRLEQLTAYGRQLPQGAFALDWYTQRRNVVMAKSTENTANVQIQANMASGYTPSANSVVRILLDKVYVVQNRLA